MVHLKSTEFNPSSASGFLEVVLGTFEIAALSQHATKVVLSGP